MSKLKRRGVKIISKKSEDPNRYLIEYDPGIKKRFLQAYAVGLSFYDSAQVAGVSGVTIKKYLLEGAENPSGKLGEFAREFSSVRNIQELKTLDAIRRMGEGLDTYEDSEIHYEYIYDKDGVLVVEDGEAMKRPVREIVRKTKQRPDIRALQWRLERQNPAKYTKAGIEQQLAEEQAKGAKFGVVKIPDQSNTEEDFKKKALENQNKLKKDMAEFTKKWKNEDSC